MHTTMYGETLGKAFDFEWHHGSKFMVAVLDFTYGTAVVSGFIKITQLFI